LAFIIILLKLIQFFEEKIIFKFIIMSIIIIINLFMLLARLKTN
jgi:hypothetical protein